jgi:hypothetical protein
MSRIESIHVAQTTERKSEPGRFERALRSAAQGVAVGVASTVELAAPYVPGGMVLSAAVRGATVGAVGRGLAASAASGSPPTGTSTGTGTGEGDLIEATRTLQQQSQAFNLQYLQLQEAMQRESREFTALSNVMKVKHDSAKSAINNIH